MQDHDFEKQVHEKMEGLRFTPSESVWERVEQRIRTEGRRLNPLFWLFMALGLALMGSLMMVGLSTEKDNKTPFYSAETSHSNRALVNKVLAKPASSLADKEAPTRQGRSLVTRLILSDNPRQDRNHGASGWAQVQPNPDKPADFARTGRQTRSEFIRNEEEQTSNRLTLKTGTDLKVVPLATIPSGDMSLSLSGKGSGLVLAGGSSAGKKNSASSRSSSKKQWYWGGQVSAGISTTYQDFFKNEATGPVANSAYYGTSRPAPVTYYAPSEISPGFSFGGGVFAERVLSPAFSLTGGLNYHYYSNSFKTGSFVNNPAIVLAGNTLTYVSSGYYQSGSSSTYTNQYHFLEVPLRVSYQINREDKAKILFFTEAGCSFAWLMNSNALHFDYLSGTYYKDNHLLNKTQLNASLAVEAGFYHQRALIKVGPEVQYGLTNMLINATGQKQHLFFGGIKLVYIHAKK